MPEKDYMFQLLPKKEYDSKKICAIEWRFRVENGSFWVNIIKSLYGREGGLGINSVSNGGSLWSSIIRLHSDISLLDLNLNSSFVKSIGDGVDTLFWEDLWHGNVRLKEKFPRHFLLETCKTVRVCDRIVSSNNRSGGSFSWQWSRPLFGRSASECLMLESELESVRIDINNKDRWTWKMNDKGFFKTSIMAAEQDENILQSAFQYNGIVRNSLAPKKVEIFAWRSLRRSIPTRVELDKKGIDLNSVRCPMCDDSLETIDHSIIFL
ncbi:uncharacterized protein [Rutidosis leptorrhynchoides]|uniref:uncharacterized protein n=1 Tax=Rutidosis leptorrhynchoides TaxID=125765 RepID=UPI003A9A473F